MSTYYQSLTVLIICKSVLYNYVLSTVRMCVAAWKLEQVFETLLFDSPASLGVTRLAKSDKDALLIGFKEAKVSYWHSETCVI